MIKCHYLGAGKWRNSQFGGGRDPEEVWMLTGTDKLLPGVGRGHDPCDTGLCHCNRSSGSSLPNIESLCIKLAEQLKQCY